MDGQESMRTEGEQYLPETDMHVVEILGLLHASSYLWKAADLLFASGDSNASRQLKRQLYRLLCGQANFVVLTIRRKGTCSTLRANSVNEIDKICGYLETNIHRMVYDQYLDAGYLIVSGVIERACRCVVNEQMERSGMRWVINGAQSMLGMRGIHLGALWDDLISFHIDREVTV